MEPSQEKMILHTIRVNGCIMVEHHARTYWLDLIENDESRGRAMQQVANMAELLQKIIDAYVDLLYFKFGTYTRPVASLRRQGNCVLA